MFRAVPPPIIRSIWMRISISSTIPACSSFGSQYLKLYVQLCAADDGRRNRPKHVELFRNK